MNKFRLGLSGTACVSIDLFGKFIIGLLSIGIANETGMKPKFYLNCDFYHLKSRHSATYTRPKII